jgi:hypothetical protein
MYWLPESPRTMNVSPSTALPGCDTRIPGCGFEHVGQCDKSVAQNVFRGENHGGKGQSVHGLEGARGRAGEGFLFEKGRVAIYLAP